MLNTIQSDTKCIFYPKLKDFYKSVKIEKPQGTMLSFKILIFK